MIPCRDGEYRAEWQEDSHANGKASSLALSSQSGFISSSGRHSSQLLGNRPFFPALLRLVIDYRLHYTKSRRLEQQKTAERRNLGVERRKAGDE
jgi:hypothetical protein